MEPFGVAHAATEGALGFDCDTSLNPAQIMAFASAGYKWCARYLSRGEEGSQDLGSVEVRAIQMCGLAVVPIQHVSPAPWAASAALGRVLGKEAAQNALSIGCPPGVALWLDLEGVTPECTAEEVAGFCNAWTACVKAAGFDAGLYVGFGCGLDTAQLYYALTVKRYWRSLSPAAPVVDVRGFQIVQSVGSTLGGVAFDRDVIAKDALGELPVWWAPS